MAATQQKPVPLHGFRGPRRSPSPLALALLSAVVVSALAFALFGYQLLWAIGDSLAVLNDRSARPITVTKQQPLQVDEKVVGQVTEAIPTSVDSNRLAVAIESVAREQGVVLLSRVITPQKAGATTTTSTQAQQQALQDPPGTESVLVVASASGSYGQLVAFVERLTSIPRFIEVKEVSLQMTQATASSSSQLTVQVTGTAYSLPAPDLTQ